MPAERKTSSKTKSSRTLRTRDSNRKVVPPTNDIEVIVLSDSEDDNTLLARAHRTRKRQTPAPSKTSAESSTVAKLRQEIEGLKKDNATLSKSLSAANKRSEPNPVGNPPGSIDGSSHQHTTQDYSEFEERITCEICAMKMWSPCTLSECGHTFCEKCLHSWFNTTYTRHVDQHPEFLAGPQIPEEYMVHQNDPRFRDIIDHYLKHWQQRVPKPVYTCPSCRIQIKRKPVEVFAIKDMVRLVSRMVDGEGSPKTKRSNRAVGNIFDGFFPSKHNTYV